MFPLDDWVRFSFYRNIHLSPILQGGIRIDQDLRRRFRLHFE